MVKVKNSSMLKKQLKVAETELTKAKEKIKDLLSKLKESGKAQKLEIAEVKEENDQLRQKLDEITPLFGEISLENARLKKQLRNSA